MSPIFRLPVEIISTILCHYQQSAVAEDDTSVEWTQITHVCRQWRDISVNLPKLWTHIAFNYPKWTDEMLIRSRNLGLVISVSPSLGTHSSLGQKLRFIQSYIKKHITRVQEINIRSLPQGRYSLVLETLFPPRSQATSTRYAPRLTSLRLLNCSLLRDPMLILEGYFVYANKLKVLEVISTNNWDSRLFMNLIYLRVENPQSFQRPSAISFYSALKRMPLLQSLELRGAVLPDHPPRDRSGNGFGPASLLALKNLVLVDEAATLPIFFAYVNFPSASLISVRCSSPASEYRCISDTVAGLPTIYTPLSLPVRGLRLDITKTYVNIRHPESLQVDFDIWSDVPSTEALLPDDLVTPFNGDAFLSLGLAWKTTGAVHSTVEAMECRGAVADFCLAVPCKQLSILALTSSKSSKELPLMDDAIFQDILGTQPALHTVFVTGAILNMLLKNLSPQTQTSTQPPPHQNNTNDPNDPFAARTQLAVFIPKVIFPNMRTLSISDVDFSHPLASNLLFDCLFARSVAGNKLETVILSDCHGLKKGHLIELLSHVVSNVVYHESPFD